jgi:AbrB family looped-hinge helix DNA binding protein
MITMTTTMDAAGRLVLPKAIRERAQLLPGVPLEVRVVDGRIEIEPVSATVTLTRSDGFWVAAPAEDVPVLSQAQVDNTLEGLRTPTAVGSRHGD